MAFNQVPVKKEHKHYTEYTVPGRGVYQFKRLPFGLSVSPGTLQELMDDYYNGHFKAIFNPEICEFWQNRSYTGIRVYGNTCIIATWLTLFAFWIDNTSKPRAESCVATDRY